MLLGDTPYQAEIGSLSVVNTFLGSAAGCIAALVTKAMLVYRQTGDVSLDLVASMNGSLSGLVSVTAGCGTFEPWAAVLTGTLSGVMYLWGSNFLIKIKLDDAVDAIPVHMLAGSWGLIAVGLFASPDRLFQAYGIENHPGAFYAIGKSGVDANLLACQLIGILLIFAWTLFTMVPFFMWLNFMGWLRSDSVQELVGLDITYGAEDALQAAQQDQDDGVKEEYLDAYQRYRRAHKGPLKKKSSNDRPRKRSMSVDHNDNKTEPTISVPIQSS